MQESAFRDCTALSDVYFHGSQVQWERVQVAENNEMFLNATLHILATPVVGDVDENYEVDVVDVIRLLLHVTMPEDFPL